MDEPIVPLPPRESHLRHRKERNRQILAPIIIIAALGLALAAFIIYATLQGGDLARWAAIATILLLLPVMLVSFLLLIILIFFIYEAGYIYKILPKYSGQAQDAFLNVTAQVNHYADMSTAPILVLKSWISIPGKMFRKG